LMIQATSRSFLAVIFMASYWLSLSIISVWRSPNWGISLNDV